MHEWTTISLFAIQLLPLLWGALDRRADAEPRDRSVFKAASFLIWHLQQALFIAWAFGAGLLTMDGVGLTDQHGSHACLWVGSAAYFAWAWMSRWLWGRPGIEFVRQQLRNHGRWWPRTRTGRGLRVLGLAINPFAEEIITRGVLVYMVGQVSGSVVLGFSIGLAICLILHLYQGASSIPAHILFYVITVALLYSPVGLWGAIVCHLWGDLHPVFGGRASFEWLRRMRTTMARAPR